jgi:hypothetical protein
VPSFKGALDSEVGVRVGVFVLTIGDVVPAAVVIDVLLRAFVATGDSRIGVEREELVEVLKITGGSVD